MSHKSNDLKPLVSDSSTSIYSQNIVKVVHHKVSVILTQILLKPQPEKLAFLLLSKVFFLSVQILNNYLNAWSL